MRNKTRSRKLALQALYQWDFNHSSAQQLIDQFYQQHQLTGNNGKVDWELFTGLVQGVIRLQDQLDSLIQPHLTRQMHALDPTEKQLLRSAGYELIHQPESPTMQILDDSIHLARTFGGTDSHKLINAVLDRFIRTLDTRRADLSRPA